MIKVLADKNLYKLSSFIPDGIELCLYDPENGWDLPSDCEALLIRTVSPVTQETLPDLPGSLRFVATGSSGTDHIDIPYLKEKGISVHDAKGCNARAVAEYVITALLLWSFQKKKNLDEHTIGIIGCGFAGSALSRVLDEFGINYISYDPPREVRDITFKGAGLDEVLNADILSFHAPLTDSGLYPTRHWLDEEKLRNRTFECVINAARGGITDESALLKALKDERIGCLITDVWENEPDMDQEMLDRSFIATPHIAGYSEQAKLMATKMICDALARYFRLESRNSDLMDDIRKPELNNPSDRYEVLTALHPVMDYDQKLRKISVKTDREVAFRKLRTGIPFRYEYSNLMLSQDLMDRFPLLRKLGCKSY